MQPGITLRDLVNVRLCMQSGWLVDRYKQGKKTIFIVFGDRRFAG
jgi:aconitase B